MFEYEESAYQDAGSKENVIRAFIGKKEAKMYSKLGLTAFNLPAFIFPMYYLIFRKCYISGAIVYGVLFALGTLALSDGLNFMLALVLRLALGMMFYMIYQWEITRRIDKWTAEGKDYKEMELMAVQKGGTNIPLVIAIIAIETLINYIYYVLIFGAAGYSIYDLLIK